MGGFLICRRDPEEPLDDLESRYGSSLEVFEKKNLELRRKVERKDYVAYIYGRLLDNEADIVEFANGDFVFASGTLLYEDKSGKPALDALYADFASDGLAESKLTGSFCVVISKGDELSLFMDYCGYYPVYVDANHRCISNSFIAVARQLDRLSLHQQAFYEFVLHGFFVDSETLLAGIETLDSTRLWHLWPELRAVRRRPEFRPLDPDAAFTELVSRFHQDLCAYFSNVVRVFDGRFGTALSGGFDTRHMLGLLRHFGQRPELHVYGDSAANDVRVAKLIADGECLDLEHIDKGKRRRVSVEEFATGFERDLYFFDGIKPLGVFDDGSDFETRVGRAKQAACQLNGAGGEIYREIWNIGDRRISVLTFLRMRYDRGTYAFCRPPFRRSEYFDQFGSKVRNLLNIKRAWLKRSEVELLFPFLRNRFASINNSINNQISPSLLPYMEPGLVFPSADVPIRLKYHGRLHCALIVAVDPRLAAYDSSYGINFTGDVPAAYRAKVAINRHIPLALRLARRRSNASRAQSTPYYLQAEYLDSVIDSSTMRIDEYVDAAKIDDPEILSRALSVEAMCQTI